MSFMRSSKFRHVFGTAHKKDQCYDNIRITRTSWESTYCAVNPKFVAVVTEGNGGTFLVLPLAKVGRVPVDHPLVAGHKGAILDIAWCPHDDNIIASASDDSTIKIWDIPEDALESRTEALTQERVTLEYHEKRVTLVLWHPSAKNILLSASSDFTCVLWDVGSGEPGSGGPITQIEIGEQVWAASFSYNGSKFCCTAKDKKLRVIDSHSGEILVTKDCHRGTKPAQCAYLKTGEIFTTGFSKMSTREYALWDEKDLSQKMCEDIDNSNGVNFVFYDPDTAMLYLCGKGDSVIRYYEVTNVDPYVHYLAMFQSKDPQRGMGWMPKRGLNVNANEIARFYKLHNSGLVEVIPFTVPRKSEMFQEDLFPDTAAEQAAITADDFINGQDADPVTISLKGDSSTTKKEKKLLQRKSNLIQDKPKKPAAAVDSKQSSNNAAAEAAAAPSLPPKQVVNGGDAKEVNELKDTVSLLKKKVESQDKVIEALEARLAALEASSKVGQEEVQGEAEGEEEA